MPLTARPLPKRKSHHAKAASRSEALQPQVQVDATARKNRPEATVAALTEQIDPYGATNLAHYGEQGNQMETNPERPMQFFVARHEIDEIDEIDENQWTERQPVRIEIRLQALASVLQCSRSVSRGALMPALLAFREGTLSGHA